MPLLTQSSVHRHAGAVASRQAIGGLVCLRMCGQGVGRMWAVSASGVGAKPRRSFDLDKACTGASCKELRQVAQVLRLDADK